MITRFSLVLLSLTFALQPVSAAKKKQSEARVTPYAEWIEPDFPFFSSTLDARDNEHELLKNNLTPRGIILNLGNDCWACFDIDLLRMSAMWHGKAVTEDGLAQKSYHPWGSKTRGGMLAPKPLGKPFIANGIYPGWQVGEKPKLVDPRTPAPDPNEVGRGGLPWKLGRFLAVRLINEGVVLEYEVAGTKIEEWVTYVEEAQKHSIQRKFRVGPSKQPLVMAVGMGRQAWTFSLATINDAPVDMEHNKSGNRDWRDVYHVTLKPHDEPVEFRVYHDEHSFQTGKRWVRIPKTLPDVRWPESVVTKAVLSKAKGAYVVDDIALPLPNPWKRNIRPGDIQFLPNGTGVVPCLDGDVWLVEGLKDSLEEIRWRRFAAGLHEPMTCAIRDGEIFVFDKNGIWKLKDTNGDGEADVHELFSNAFGQTIDLREFPSTIRNAPNGEFVIAKGGQQKTYGKHNGSVLRISKNGRKATVLGYGFRQPAVGVNIRAGLVTSGDQEGQYIPSTPLHEVRDGQFYGYIDDGIHGREVSRTHCGPDDLDAAFSECLSHIAGVVVRCETGSAQQRADPHRLHPTRGLQDHAQRSRTETAGGVEQRHHRFSTSAVERFRESERWTAVCRRLPDPRLGKCSEPPRRHESRALHWSARHFAEESHPDGQGRVAEVRRDAGSPAGFQSGQLFDCELGLPTQLQIRLRAVQGADGKPGIDWHAASSAYLSKNGLSVFVGIPEMKPVQQFRIGWSLKTANGQPFEKNAYTTPHSLAPFDPRKEGFGDIKVDLTPRALVKQEEGPVTLEEGRRLYGLLGCVACHSVNGDTVAKVGPTWMGLFGSERDVVIDKKRTKAKADVAYLRESILDPTAKVVKGFEKGEYAMPSYAGVLTDSQIEALILYIRGVKDGDQSAAAAAPAATGSFE